MSSIGPLLLAGGGGSLLAAIGNAILNRRKLGADTASVLTKAASGLVQDLSDQIARLKEQVDELETRLKAMNTELDAAHDLNRHKDDLIAALTREHSERLTDPTRSTP